MADAEPTAATLVRPLARGPARGPSGGAFAPHPPEHPRRLVGRPPRVNNYRTLRHLCFQSTVTSKPVQRPTIQQLSLIHI
eukprot:1413515-Alexandrium_andersonii.AAC.1